MKIPVGHVEVDLIDEGDRIVAHMKSGNGFERRTLGLWAMLCSRGGCVADIGAYTGLFAISAALLGCEVVAFEPMPANAERLNENAKRNGVRGQIRVIEGVAGDEDFKQVGIHYSPSVVGLTSGASLLRKSGDVVEVPMMRLDFLRIPQLSALKIDVERAEPMVLAGARRTIRRCKPPVIVEVLEPEIGVKVLDLLPHHRLEDVMDSRNWYMAPC